MSLAEELAADPDLRLEARLVFSAEDDNSGASLPSANPPGRVADVVRIWGSERLGDLLAKVASGCEQPSTVWEASAACSDLDGDLGAAHALLRALYGRRFPELEALVRAGAAYAAVARRLGCGSAGGGGAGYGGVAFGGGLGGGAVAAALAPLLPPASVMVVSLAAATTRGRSLTEHEQECVTEVLDAEAGMTAARAVLGAYVEARMAAAAPELAAVLGAEAAARLVAAAGGLHKLARTPACNVLALAKAAAAASGAVERRLRQLQAPPPPKETRALARPPPGVGLLGGSVGGGTGVYVGGGAGRRRGGRRARRQRRQRGQLTALARLRNRVRLADAWTGAPPEADGCWGWAGDGGGGGGVGGGAAGPGGVRAPPPDDRTKVRISRALQRRLAVERERCLGAGDVLATPTPGTASSVAFSTVEGLEIVHPAAAAAEALPRGRGRYFADVGAC
ncbi:U4/U6 small nuclear ribonucleoprotein Prp31-like [Schistocerca americana]|uniref:U4/U6 small nuclear ribonucleoprotein Prp31-like n=1 Tax=Schistocerca americana TaxID=7009 RepID=UPI001F4FB247|nr:U4/U6 small nuclear ribonucleoprotein Prp31-like [Schistocerca americana]